MSSAELAEVRDQLGNHLAALAARPEFPGAAGEHPLFALKRDQSISPWQRLTVPREQLGLVVKRIELAAGPRTENHEHVLGTGREVWFTGRERPRRVNQRTDRLFGTHAALFGRQGPITLQQVGQRHTA